MFVCVLNLVYNIGKIIGINKVVTECSHYNKYALEDTQVLLCSGLVDTKSLLEQTMQHVYTPYDKELVKQNRKKRK